MQVVPIPGGIGTPFRLNSLPQNAFAHSGWARAEQQALASIRHHRHLLLLGKPGTGKSLLLRSLDRTLKNEGANVHYLRNSDLLDQLADDDVLLVDEATLLAEAKLEQLLRLPNALVMAGLPSLPERLSSCLSTVQCITLEPLTPEDVACFVIAQLVANGRARKTFTPEALIKLAHESDGLLRLVITLAGAALFFAEERGAAQVTADDLAEAVTMRSFAQEEVKEPSASNEETIGLRVPVEGLAGENTTRETSETGLSWLASILDRGRWHRVVGLTAWVCSSIAVIGVATMIARGIKPVPSLAVQEIQGRSMPQMADVPVPDLAPAAAMQSAALTHGQLAVALPPIRAVTILPPALTGTLPPEARLWDTRNPQSDVAGENMAAQVFAAKPAVTTNPTDQPATVLSFTGPIINDTMKRDGQLSLHLRVHGAHGPATAVFYASQGLIGSGTLTGDVGGDGRITLSGRLMMGRNPFDCTLQATVEGERLVGTATFVRVSSGATAHSSFELSQL